MTRREEDEPQEPANTAGEGERNEGETGENPAFGHETTTQGTVHVETGRGQTAEVPVGTPFGETIERVADEAHYGGYFRVFLNGEEILDPTEAPETIEVGMRIAVCSYDKVGKRGWITKAK